MTSLRTGPSIRPCAICHVEGTAPDIVPYLGRDGHTWMHPLCCEQVYAAKAENAAMKAVA